MYERMALQRMNLTKEYHLLFGIPNLKYDC